MLLLFVLRVNTDSVDVLKATFAGPSFTIVVFVAFVIQAIARTVALHVNTAVVPSGTGDGLSSVTLTSDELPLVVTARVKKMNA